MTNPAKRFAFVPCDLFFALPKAFNSKYLRSERKPSASYRSQKIGRGRIRLGSGRAAKTQLGIRIKHVVRLEEAAFSKLNALIRRNNAFTAGKFGGVPMKYGDAANKVGDVCDKTG